jgi:hypothetical protein
MDECTLMQFELNRSLLSQNCSLLIFIPTYKNLSLIKRHQMMLGISTCTLILNHKVSTQTKQAHHLAQGGEASKCDPSPMDEPTDNKNGWRYQEHNDYVTATN